MLNEELQAELERRLAIIADEQGEDPSFSDLPRADHLWLWGLLLLSCLTVPLWQAL